MKTLTRWFAVTLLTASFALLAQSLGTITGTVQDSSGAPIPAATINVYIAGGSSPILSTQTSESGLFTLSGVRADYYDLSVETQGFRKLISRRIKVDPAATLSLPPFSMELSSVSETIEVTTEITGVQTSNAEVVSVITNEQVKRLPTINRSPLAFITTQAGVGSSGRGSTSINGMRPSFTNITIDGINIQDNFIRTNAIDFLPNLLLLDQVAEFSVSTTNTSVAQGNGASQVTFVTPSGTNQYHGSVYWFNRNNALAANTWFNNRSGIKAPFLNQNQIGASFGGKIIKDKLFFYTNYEAFRLRQQSAATRTILTDSARNGIFTYRDTGGNVQQVNVLRAAGVQASQRIQGIIQQIPAASFINRPDIGDGLNTAGYGFNIRNNRTRDNATAKIDYYISSKHSMSGTYLWNRDIVDRPDLSNNYTTIPLVANDGSTPLMSLSYRWNPLPTLTNELRGGFNRTPAVFLSGETFGDAIFGLPLVNNPVNTFRSQGRQTNTYNMADNASWVKGSHTMNFGAQFQRIYTAPYNEAGITPTYTLGISPANTLGLTGTQLPGIRPQDVGLANGLLALQAGFLASATQTLNATSTTSGYVANAAIRRNYELSNLALYFGDTWKMTRKLTMTLGVRWEYYTVLKEQNGLLLTPEISGGNVINTLLSNSTLNFASGDTGRSLYNPDRNNFGPNIGVAYQPRGDGKTVIRGGYSVQFPNDEFIRGIGNSAETSEGISTASTLVNLTQQAGSTLPAINVPAFRVPRTFADNYRVNPQTAFATVDPNLRTPYVQQWNIGVQQELKGGVFEVRYVGNRATKQFRAFDLNQVVIDQLLPDFQRALNNGNIARSATGTFNPAYNPALAGSQPIPFFDRLASGGLLTNATIRNLIETGSVGELANTYQVNGLNGSINFYRNTNALGTNLLTNYSNASYHGLQTDYSRRYKAGLQFQANYTYAKVMSDTAGDNQARFEPFLDNNNAQIERARAAFDLTHSFKVNSSYELPFGPGKPWSGPNGFVNRIIGGWAISGFMTWNSGPPFSVLSSRGTLNRGARSGQNTATTLVDKEALDKLFYLRFTGNGPSFVDPQGLNTDGRGVGPDGRPAFNGQIFYNPAPGTIGALQRRYFDGPAFWNLDFAIIKTTRITERQSIELKMESSNFTNHPSFFIGDQDINSVNFGRITTTNSGRRVIQFGLYYRF